MYNVMLLFAGQSDKQSGVDSHNGDADRPADVEPLSPVSSLHDSALGEVSSPNSSSSYPWPSHLQKLPSPKCWITAIGSARLSVPPFPPADPYFYWRQFYETGPGSRIASV